MNEQIDNQIKNCLHQLDTIGARMSMIIVQDKFGNVFHYEHNITYEQQSKIFAMIEAGKKTRK